MSNAPRCPRCGSVMVLRRARRGPNAGQEFWGCSRYPACTETRELDAAEPSDSASTTAHEPPLAVTLRPPRLFPVDVHAAARQSGWQCRFFQACALPAVFVETLHMADVDRAVVRAAAQWRLDFPPPRAVNPPGADHTVLSVAESILTRGTVPLCSRVVEKALMLGQCHPPTASELTAALRRLAAAPSCRLRPLQFQSDEERRVFKLLLSWVQTEAPGWSLIPQVNLASLNPQLDKAGRERGDLLLVPADPTHAPILVEVDGAQHSSHGEVDRARDRALEAAGVRVVRVPAAEARAGRGRAIEALRTLLRASAVQLEPETALSTVVRWAKFIHQLQLTLLMAMGGGWLRLGQAWDIAVVLPAALRNDPRAATLVSLATKELQKLLRRIARLYSQPFEVPKLRVRVVDPDTGVGSTAGVLIGPADGDVDSLPAADATFLISDIVFLRDMRVAPHPTPPAELQAPDRKVVRWFLQYIFRKPDFWEGQWETIQRCLRGRDSVVLLPTGGGKSIAFQLAALLLPGRCVVVDPIISLIEDQIDNLAAVGIDRCVGITRELSTEERERALAAFGSGHYLFCYVAPERFQIQSFRDALRTLTTHTPVSLVAIDEAHCVSEWGHDFRTAYLNLGRVAREYCAFNRKPPPLVALTGTASRIVLKDVQRELDIKDFDAVISPKTFDRPELYYGIYQSAAQEKVHRVLGILQSLPSQFGVTPSRFFEAAGPATYAGLVFCPHVGGSLGVGEVAAQLEKELGIQVEVYSGEPPRNVDPESWEVAKRRAAHAFKRNRVGLMACTKAFGMGIDKPNIRYTVHIGLPPSIEAFYQEAGRAGRDRRSAHCAIVLSNDHPRRSQMLLSAATPLEEIERIVQGTRWPDKDDVVHALWFHVRAFRGVDQEVQDVARMLNELGDISRRCQVNVTWRESGWSQGSESGSDARRSPGRERAEKALHRLVVLGVVEDYTVDYASEEFGVQVAGATPEDIAKALGRYARAYQERLGEELERKALTMRRGSLPQYVIEAARLLIRFIYEHVELARRRALSEMLQAASSARTGEDLRRRILVYLEQTEWDELLGAVLTSKRGGVDHLGAILDRLVSPRDASELRAATARALASYPDVPGLLLLRSLAEALCADANPDEALQNAKAALRFGVQYGLASGEVADAWGQAIRRAAAKQGGAELLFGAIMNLPPDSVDWSRDFLRALVPKVPHRLAAAAAWLLLGRLAVRCKELVKRT